MNYKVYVKDQETSRRVQEHAFKLGYCWEDSERVVNYVNHPFLYFNYPEISFDTSNVGFAGFKDEPEIEVTPEEFLALPIPVKFNILHSPSNESFTYHNIEGEFHLCCPACTTKLTDGKCNNTNCCKYDSGFDPSTMTELRAYEIARDLWEFLYKNPDKTKQEWKNYNYYKLQDMRGNCTLCYLYNKEGLPCSDCYLFRTNICSNTHDFHTYNCWRREVKDMEKKAHYAGIIWSALNTKAEMLRSDIIKNQIVHAKEFNPNEMTEIESYKISMEMWEFLAEDPKREKRDWYNFKTYNIAEMKGDCPVCHFHKVHCSGCYLHNNNVCNSGKENNEISYYIWNSNNSSPEKRQEAARKIYEALRERYEQLLENEYQSKFRKSSKYTHEQIMTGWFREIGPEPKRYNWFKTNNYCEQHGYLVSACGTYVKKGWFDKCEYSVLPPEGEILCKN